MPLPKNRESRPFQPSSVVPLGMWLREGREIEPAPSWNFKKQCHVYSKMTVKHIHAGAVMIRSGAIAAGSPPDAKAFVREVPNGQHPVLLSKVTLANKEEVVAAASVILRSGLLDRFELARVKRNDSKDHRLHHSYAVDSAIGSFLDPEALPFLSSYMDEHEDDETEMCERLAPGASMVLDDQSGLNLIGFQTGYGDGMYNSYWGLDAKGKVLCLTTDCNVVTSFESFDQFETYSDVDGGQFNIKRLAKSAW